MDKARGLAARVGGMEKAPGLGGTPEISADRGHAPQFHDEHRPSLSRRISAIYVRVFAPLEGLTSAGMHFYFHWSFKSGTAEDSMAVLRSSSSVDGTTSTRSDYAHCGYILINGALSECCAASPSASFPASENVPVSRLRPISLSSG